MPRPSETTDLGLRSIIISAWSDTRRPVESTTKRRVWTCHAPHSTPATTA